MSTQQSYLDYLKVQLVFIRRALDQLNQGIRAVLPYALNSRTGNLQKEVTEQYPDRMSSRLEHELPARFRGTLENDTSICTGCGDCVAACPQKCIELKTDSNPDPSKLWVTQFRVDFSQCVYCSICVDVCEPESLKHSRKFEFFAGDRSQLIVDYGRGVISDDQRLAWERERIKKEQEEASI
jgi:formate hydrogenlyase subunit 6/NADH:ubiquinone oxidoreductase subunit I